MNKKNLVLVLILMIGLTLSACNPQPSQPPITTPETVKPAGATQVSPGTHPATGILPPVTPEGQPSVVTMTQIIPETLSDTPTMPPATQPPASFPFSEPGPYWPGNRVYSLVDESRNGRKIDLQIYYPALKEVNAQGGTITRDAAPDKSGAPYPLVLTGPDTGDFLIKSHLASYGFVMAILRFPDSYYFPDFQTVDHPLDVLYALDQIATKPLEGLEWVIDSDHVGVIGFSGDGYISLALSGVRIDPDFYLSFCERAPTLGPPFSEWYLGFWCHLAEKWDEFTIHVGEEITVSEDGLWQALTDERIRAVMPMAADGAQLFGERGLATTDRPMFLIAATEDEYVPYQIETEYIFEHIGSSELFLVSFIGETHEMPFHTEPANGMKHFATAFLGYYLQGREDYLDYFSEDFVAQYDNLAWGIYQGD